MKVYNKEKTKELQEYDLTKGYLKEDILIVAHPAIEGVPDEGHYKIINEYPNGGKEAEWVVDKPGIQAVPAYEEEIRIYVYIPYTKKELDEIAKQQRIVEIKNTLMSLSEDFTQATLGAQFNDLEERKETFKTLHNELRQLLGKEPREYK